MCLRLLTARLDGSQLGWPELNPGSRTMKAPVQRVALPTISPAAACAVIALASTALFLTGFSLGASRAAPVAAIAAVAVAPNAVVATAVPVTVAAGSNAQLVPESLGAWRNRGWIPSPFAGRMSYPGTVLPVCGRGTEVSDQPSAVRGRTCVKVANSPALSPRRRPADQRPESYDALTQSRPSSLNAADSAAAAGSWDWGQSTRPPAHP